MAEDQGVTDPNARTTHSMMTTIRNSARLEFVINADISILKRFHLTHKPFDELIGMQIKIYKHRLDLYKELSKSASDMIAPIPRPGIDYNKLMSRAPQITAAGEELDKMQADLNKMWFGTIISMKPDSQGHVSHLILTLDQRQALVDKLDLVYGEKLETENRYNPAMASAFKGWLLRYKCFNEPWE